MSASFRYSTASVNTIATALPLYAINDGRPPTYASFGIPHNSARADSRQALPSRLDGEPGTTHHLELRQHKGQPPWVTVEFSSHAHKETDVPHFCSGSTIKGSVSLVPYAFKNTRSISLQIRGRLVENPNRNISSTAIPPRSSTFCSTNEVLWSKSLAPIHPNSSGNCKIPFEVAFPSKMSPSPGAINTSPGLPPSFEEEICAVQVKYEITWLVEKAGLFKSVSRLHTQARYTPLVTPAPFTMLRQVAYHNGLPVPDYLADPDGWKNVSFAHFGKLSGKEMVVNGTLRLPKPLCYTRGYQVPICLEVVLQSPTDRDPGALFDVHLRRVVRLLKPGVTSKKPTDDEIARVDVRVGDVKWQREHREGQSVRLDGELYVHELLQPSCSLPISGIEYYVSVEPRRGVDWVLSHTSRTNALLQEPVEVASQLPSGPCPPSPVDSANRANWLRDPAGALGGQTGTGQPSISCLPTRSDGHSWTWV
ncbi:hypothetical protein CYLTODRAFT_406330 [Cylindrobasidium torrendii FP15055 ss-10]|uniref:Arrestin-like N-terminal domain-containing protein n=1 Tax=Cylindrobasidium torrendii FP15055 ss-10 TaxID=1314674 RepID=A0A0D7BU51_9AGAR|nr:hypothetical protein CYLTODRAFT_406330 [Cylindrobasidium torrendii FP15055 ss-10]